MAQIMPMLMAVAPSLFGAAAGAGASALAGGTAAGLAGGAGLGAGLSDLTPAMASQVPSWIGAGNVAGVMPQGVLGALGFSGGTPPGETMLSGLLPKSAGDALQGLWRGANSPVGQMLTKDMLQGTSSSQGGVPDLTPMQLGGGPTAVPQSAIPMATRTPPQAVGAPGGNSAAIIALLKSLGIG